MSTEFTGPTPIKNESEIMLKFLESEKIIELIFYILTRTKGKCITQNLILIHVSITFFQQYYYILCFVLQESVKNMPVKCYSVWIILK